MEISVREHSCSGAAFQKVKEELKLNTFWVECGWFVKVMLLLAAAGD